MTKRGIWPVRAMYTLVAVALVISLMITAAPPSTVLADAHNDVKAEWDRVSTPSMEGWKLAPESTVVDFATAAPGEVAYAIAYTDARPDDPPEDWAPWYLVKSTDHAATWRDITSGVNRTVRSVAQLETTDDTPYYRLAKVACGPDDTDFVAVVVFIDEDEDYDGVYVFISIDGGSTFNSTGRVDPDIDDWDVFDFAVSPVVNDVRDMVVAGYGGAGESGIWRSRATGALATSWESARYNGWDDDGDFTSEAVVAVAFPSTWAIDATILAVTIDDSATIAHLQSGHWGTNPRWNSAAGFANAVEIIEACYIPWGDLRGATAGITLPTDYEGSDVMKRYAWVWVNFYDFVMCEPVGNIFWVDNANAQPVTQQIVNKPWLTNVSYLGTIASGKAIASLMGTGNPYQDPAGILTEPCTGVQVYRYLDVLNMDICCPAWRPSCKPPTGSIGMAAFYVTPDKSYAVAMGHPYYSHYGLLDYDESAWSFSFDDGLTWNQLSLIDTHISALSDVAVSPDCNKTMLASLNFGPDLEWFWDSWGEAPYQPRDWFCDSVWYHAETQAYAPEYSGKWLRTWSGKFQQFDLALYGQYTDFFASVLGWEPGMLPGEMGEAKRGLLRLAPEETNAQTVYVFSHGGDRVYWNDMQTLACWSHGSASVENIADLALKNATTVYAVDFGGEVAMSDDYAKTHRWQEAEDSELDSGWTIAVWGDEILVGGQEGDVAYSDSGAGNFTATPKPATAGLVTVAFDTYYGANGAVYAGTARFPEFTGDIYLWIMDETTSWINLGARPTELQLTGDGNHVLTNRVAYTGIVLDSADGNPKSSAATGGVLYASYVAYYDGYYYTGVARALTPLMEVDDCALCPVEWDYLIVSQHEEFDDASFIMAPHALKICGCLTADSYTRLFAIGWDHDKWFYDMEKGEFGTVWRFIDCYSKVGVDLRNPADGWLAPSDPCAGCWNAPFTINWDRLCDACVYEYQFATDASFDYVVYMAEDVLGSPAHNPTSLVPEGILQPGETYYWRVRARQAGTEQWIRSWWSDTRSVTIGPALGTGVYLVAPGMGATGQPRTNIAFVWDSVSAFDSYNFVLSRNADFSAPDATANGLTTKAYTYTGANLAYDTPYYWKVTAIQDGAPASVAMGTFRTRPEAPAPVEPEPVTTPFWVWVIIAIGAVLVIVVIVLIFRTRRV